MINLKGKKVLITGATGGIGGSLVRKFLSLNADVLGTGTNSEKLEKLKPKIVVYFSIGLWERSSLVQSTQEINELKLSNLRPIFVHDYQKNETTLIHPAPGAVSKSVEKGVYPGGSLTAGYNLWNYLRYVKLKQAANFFYRKFLDITSTIGPENNVSKFLPFISKMDKDISLGPSSMKNSITIDELNGFG